MIQTCLLSQGNGITAEITKQLGDTYNIDGSRKYKPKLVIYGIPPEIAIDEFKIQNF